MMWKILTPPPSLLSYRYCLCPKKKSLQICFKMETPLSIYDGIHHHLHWSQQLFSEVKSQIHITTCAYFKQVLWHLCSCLPYSSCGSQILSSHPAFQFSQSTDLLCSPSSPQGSHSSSPSSHKEQNQPTVPLPLLLLTFPSQGACSPYHNIDWSSYLQAALELMNHQHPTLGRFKPQRRGSTRRLWALSGTLALLLFLHMYQHVLHLYYYIFS